MADIRWIASYPKSGNTWVRLLLASVARGGEEPDFDDLGINSGHIAAGEQFEDLSGLDPNTLSPETVDHLRPSILRDLAAGQNEPLYAKTHEPFRETVGGEWLMPPDISGPSLYIIRDPRDVAVSYAHHNGRDVDWAIAAMADPAHYLRAGHLPSAQLPQRIGTWRDHVASWTDAPLPRLMVRYEDLWSSPAPTLSRILDHLGVPASSTVVERAIDACAFERLKRREERQGFAERPSADRAFFRMGKVGDWRDELTPEQARRLEAENGEMMRLHGYAI